MCALRERYGIPRFDFVHDMLTVDRRRVVALCETLIAAGAPFEWNCSARTDRVDDDLLDQMARAGCRGIFFGIETGSPSLQRTMQKRLDLKDAPRKIEAAARRDMSVVASLITGFPDERAEDLRQTVDFFVRCLRLPAVSPQLHILAPLAGSPVHAAFQGELRFDDVVSDMSHCGWTQDPDDRRAILAHPEVFASFYAVPTALDRTFLKELRLLLSEGAATLRLLLLAVHLERHLVDALVAFRAWLGPRCPAEPHLSDYYRSAQWPLDFIRFVAEEIVPGAGAPHALTALICLWQAAQEARETQREGAPPVKALRRAPGIALAAIDADHRQLAAVLTAAGDLRNVALRSEVVLVKAERGAVQMFALPPLTAAALRLCDGRRTEREVTRALRRDAALTTVTQDPAKTCAVALKILRERGWIVGGARRPRASPHAKLS